MFRFQVHADPPSDFRFEAREDDVPVGVVWARLRPGGVAELSGLTVDETRRRRGVGLALLQAAEAALRSTDVTRLEAWYDGDRTDVDRLLSRAGWKRDVGIFWARGTSQVLAAPWMQVSLQPDDAPFAWSELTDAEADGLREQSWYPDYLSPFPEEAVEPLNSLGLRRGGRVVGWVLTHRLDADTIRYTRLCVHPDHRTRGRGIALLGASIRRQIEAGVKYGFFGVRSENRPMVRFLHGRMLEHLEEVKESRLATRSL